MTKTAKLGPDTAFLMGGKAAGEVKECNQCSACCHVSLLLHTVLARKRWNGAEVQRRSRHTENMITQLVRISTSLYPLLTEDEGI